MRDFIYLRFRELSRLSVISRLCDLYVLKNVLRDSVEKSSIMNNSWIYPIVPPPPPPPFFHLFLSSNQLLFFKTIFSSYSPPSPSYFIPPIRQSSPFYYIPSIRQSSPFYFIPPILQSSPTHSISSHSPINPL